MAHFREDQAEVNRLAVLQLQSTESNAIEWLFPQEKATLHAPQKVYVYSGNALAENNLGFEALNWEP
jgi:fatty acid-binding protein DegV